MSNLDPNLPPTSRRNLRARLVWLVALASFVSALIPFGLWSFTTQRELRQSFDEAGPVALALSKERLRADLATARAEVEQIGSRYGAGGGIAEADLRQALAGSQLFSALVLVDGEGNVQSAAGRGPMLESLLTALQATNARDHELVAVMQAAELRKQLGCIDAADVRALETSDQAPLPVACAPLRDASGSRLGALHGLLKRERIRQALPSSLLGITAVAALAPPEGQPVAVSLGEGELASPSSGREVGRALLPLLGPGWSLRYVEPLDALGWTLVVETPVLEAFQPLWRTLVLAAVLPPLLALAFAALAFWRAGRLARPLWAVYESLRAVASNEEPREVECGSASGESGSLIEALNAGIRRLQAQKLEAEREKQALREQNEAFRKRDENLSKITVTDPLTQVANRRYLDEQLNLEVKRLSRHGEGLSMLIADVDDFKQLNDNFGHAAGDEFLKQIARILCEKVRETDLVARFGGEEFVVVAPDTRLEGAMVLGEKVRTAVAEASFIVDDTMRPRRATISVGVAEFGGSLTSLFNAADAALYEAKSSGKNCVVAARREDAASE